MKSLGYVAGWWEQDRGLVVISRHATPARAEAAARWYARRLSGPGRPTTGGPLSWSGGWADDAGPVTWVDRTGRVQLVDHDRRH